MTTSGNEQGPAVVYGEVDPIEKEVIIDIFINNVVSTFNVCCHLDLREIALKGYNVEYRREECMVTMKLRRPYTTATIRSSGRITCTGAKSERHSKIAARRYARCLQKMGYDVRFTRFRVVNVFASCCMPWAINVFKFAQKYRREASYEPELHPGVTYNLRGLDATLKIYYTGSITVIASNVADVEAAVVFIFPLVQEFRRKRSPQETERLRMKHQNSEIHCVIDNMSKLGKANKPNSSVAQSIGPFPSTSAASNIPVMQNYSAVNDISALQYFDDNIIVYSPYEDDQHMMEGLEDEEDPLLKLLY